MNAETRNCKNCSHSYTIEPDDFSFYETIKVPPPTWCPRCRLIRRLSWQGYRILYKRKCDFTGEMVISTHHPDSPYRVYRQDVWWSDKWDPKSYGRDVDFNRPFLEQFAELMHEVPLPSLYTAHSTLVNSEYTNAVSNLKNCYLVFRVTGAENSAYLNVIVDAKECFDVSFTNHGELSYGSVRTMKCSRAFHSQDCDDCVNIWFSRDLIGCSDCIGCINLRNKKYHIFNEPYAKEDYEKFFRELNLGSASAVKEFKKKTEEFFLTQPRKQFHGRKNQDVTGDYVYNSKNVQDSYMLGNGEDLRYCYLLKDGPARKSYDWSIFGDGGEWIYESVWVGLTASHNRFSAWNYWCHDIEYSFGCMSSGNLFGCVGIRKGEYCILNKQYSKEEYKELVELIREQMTKIPYTDRMGRAYRYGEMLPAEISPWAYNESTAYEWFSKSKEEATKEGFSWRDTDLREYQNATISISDHINDVTDEILKGILKCESCGKNYQIINMELAFYRRFQIPIPTQCPLCRDRARIKQLNPIAIYNRTCVKCRKAIQTSYAPDRKEIVYCESCYNAEVV